MDAQTKVYITGCGVVSGLGLGVDSFWQNLLDGKTAIEVKSDWNTPDLDCSTPIFFGKCPDFSISDYFKDLKPPFPLKYSQLAMLGCKLAIDDAGLDLASIQPEQIGLVLDTSCSSNAAAETFLYKLFQDGPAKVSPFIFTKTTTNCALGDVARVFTLRGPSSILLGENSACYGYDLIKDGKADVVICGGFDEIREISLLANQFRGYYPSVFKNGKEQTFAEALETEEGSVVYGEGAGFVVLESEAHAQKRGAKIYAEMVDFHISGDPAYHDFMYDRSAASITEHLQDFVENSNINLQDVALMIGGSCLPWNVRTYEAPAINEIWTDNQPYYTTIKGKTGEGFSASPLMSLITGALCMKHNVIVGSGYDPQQVGLGHIAPQSALNHTFENGAMTLVNSIHMGGNTVTIALKNKCMETVSNPSDFYEKYGQTFKVAYRSAYQQVVAREEAKRSSFQLKDWVFLTANLANFMPSIDTKNYETIYHKLLTNHLLSGTSFNYIDFDSMKYMRIEGNTEFLKPESAKTPKIFCTYHLGGYRAIFAMLLKFGYHIALVIDKKTYKQQKETIENVTQQLNNHHGTNLNVRILEAESPAIGKNMAMSVLAGYSVLIFLDGNTGVGGLYSRTEKQLKLKFLNQDIYSRTGIATLSYAMKIPIVPLISYYETINEVEVPLYFAAEPIVPNSSNLTQQEYIKTTTIDLYALLEKYLITHTDQWESWFYFHKFLALENNTENQVILNKELPVTVTYNFEQFGLFKLHEEAYIFDKKNYLAFALGTEEFQVLTQLKEPQSHHLETLCQQYGNEWIGQLINKNILVSY